MQYVVVNNRTDLLESLSQISSYYHFLDNHSVVREVGIRWQNEAASLTANLSKMPLAIGTGYLTGGLYSLLMTYTHQDDKVNEELNSLLS